MTDINSEMLNALKKVKEVLESEVYKADFDELYDMVSSVIEKASGDEKE